MSYAIERSSGMYRGHWPNPRTGKVVPHFTWHKMDMVKKFDTELAARRCIQDLGMKGCKVVHFAGRADK